MPCTLPTTSLSPVTTRSCPLYLPPLIDPGTGLVIKVTSEPGTRTYPVIVTASQACSSPNTRTCQSHANSNQPTS
ncbi:hypothetical protein LSTR_LSTR016951 [Laodelphax striatellus]|uniref:Uncharacterized protein n=1 Tax=Laodelphax striatellus TaxID=195883 RepID=A0A482WLU8_LAOST|nr:hypothetical protein LSTR_LSTR016951 [Laodelphax striatellus]